MTQFQPTYSDQLICGTGQIAIVTGWTPKEIVAKKLSPDQYAVIGNLYSPVRGISPLVRNLLANPHVRGLIIIEGTKEDKTAGSCQCLKDFLVNGVFKSEINNKWKVSSNIEGYIDSEISFEALEMLRQSVCWTYINSLLDLSNAFSYLGQVLKQPKWNNPYCEPQHFPDSPIPKTEIFPSSIYGHRIEGNSIPEAWLKILHRVRRFGVVKPTQYGMKSQELIDLMIVIQNEGDRPDWLPFDQTLIDNYIPQICEDTPLGTEYTYGQRIHSHFDINQVDEVVRILRENSHSRRAIINLWDTRSDFYTNNPPCLNHISFLIDSNNRLIMTATFRSNDMYSAFYLNAMGLRALQSKIASKIECLTGELIIISQSAHVYEDCWENADSLVKEHYKVKPQYDDPVGNFIIKIQSQLIIVEHTDCFGRLLNIYQGEKAGKLTRTIAHDCPTLEVSHALYLGQELQKAETALLMGIPQSYVQDQFIKDNSE